MAKKKASNDKFNWSAGDITITKAPPKKTTKKKGGK